MFSHLLLILGSCCGVVLLENIAWEVQQYLGLNSTPSLPYVEYLEGEE